MTEKEQEKVWDEIAPEWFEFKDKPSEQAIKFLEDKEGNILDLGSGAGRHLINLKTKGKMHLLDFSKEMIELAKRRAKEKNIKAEFTVSSMTKLPLEDNSFDSAICVSSLHCIEGEENRKKAIQELHRILKPGATAYIGVWNIKSKRFKNSPKEKMISWREKGKRYYYLYDEKEVHDLFKEIGFQIISTHNSEMMINFVVKK